MRTILVVVDTLRYDEALLMRDLLARPHRWCSKHWGCAPYTLPAMASIVSGLPPHEHGYWHDLGHTKTPIKSTIGTDFGRASAVTGGGFADGSAFQYAPGFGQWKTQAGDALIPEPSAIPDADFVLLHTYSVHNYVFDSAGSKNVHELMVRGVALPSVMAATRRARIAKVEPRIAALLDAFPDRRVIVTADHGEGFTPGVCYGHSPREIPCDELLHLPLIEFGPNVEVGLDRRFVPQNRLRAFLRDGSTSEDPVPIEWPDWPDLDREGERFTLRPSGIVRATM